MPSIDSIIERQIKQWEAQHSVAREKPQPVPPPPPIITVSRESGSRGSYFAQCLAEKLEYQLIHREVIDAICESSGYRKRIIESLDEQDRSRLEIMVQSLVTGQAVDHSDYVQHLYSVILSMADLGGVVLVGRGGPFIIGRDKGFHLRFVCAREKRIENLIKFTSVSAETAENEIDRSDDDRRAMVKKAFSADIDDPHHYDLVVNTEYLEVEDFITPTIKAIMSKIELVKA
ncbi:MAG: cytidylate kinase-like family protein [FCB group bacterium]|nr:cytidylate kinase-like family protein [FCB group bacterium]